MPDHQHLAYILLYFFYGLAFLFLGMAIAVKDMSESRLRLADSLPSLAIFGFSHGLHELLVCYTLLVGPQVAPMPLHYMRFLTMVVSFLFLNHFGICLLRSQPRIRWQWLRVLIPFLLLLLGMYLWLNQAHLDLAALQRTGMLARLTIGVLGGVLASFALLRHARLLNNLNRQVAKNLRRAGIAFALYTVLAGIVPSHFIIPFLQVPVEVLRTLAALSITYFMVKGMNIFNVETRKKLAEQFRRLSQHEKLTALGKLAAGIAHEINNPLTNISLNVELLKQDLQNGLALPDLEKRFRSIDRNLARASTIASELLGFSSQRQTTMQPMDLNELVRGTLTLLGSRRHQYNLVTTLEPLPPVMALTVKVEEVLLNVLINAMEASEPGATIEITSRRQKNHVLIEIIDQGRGIAEQDLDHVMEPFFTTKEIGQGTGLGLALCYSILEMHGGRIELTGAEGVGTTVRLFFPIPEGDTHD